MLEQTELLKRIRSGDPEAFGELVHRYQEAIHGYAYHLTHDTSAAEDITQETFLEAYLHLDTLQESHRLGAWLRAMTYHHAMSWFRRQKQAMPLPDTLLADQLLGSALVVQDQTHAELARLLEALSEPNQLVITLKFMEGLSNTQIAEFLGISRGSINVRIHRALGQLRDRMLRGLEADYPKLNPDFAEGICREIAARRPLLGVLLCHASSHQPQEQCTCGFRVRRSAEQTGGEYREIPQQGWLILYGAEQIHEYDTHLAFECAQKLHATACPAGTTNIAVGRVNLITGHLDTTALTELAAHPNISLDSSVAWSLRYEVTLEEISPSETTVPGFQVVPARLPTDPRTPTLTGRQRELAQLDERLEHLRAGGSGIVRIIGEAGIGKTRLIEAWRDACREALVIWLQGHIQPNRPYRFIRESLRSHLGSECADVLQAHLESLGIEVASPYFADFLQIPFEDPDGVLEGLTAEQIYYRTAQYLREWLTQLAEQLPVVWIIEDIHWLDQTTAQLTQYLCQVVETSPVLVVSTQRSGYGDPQNGLPWQKLIESLTERFGKYLYEIQLGPISEDASRALLKHWIGPRKLLPEGEARLLKQAGGNPLHLRELAQQSIRDNNEVPASLERLILARLEQLPAYQQSLLRYASIIGSTVPLALLAKAFPELDIPHEIQQLSEAGWLRMPGGLKENQFDDITLSQASCAWIHDLYRESLYQNILPEARRQIHTEIAACYEQLPDISPGVLAEHYSAAGVADKTALYASHAATLSEERWEYPQVFHYASMAFPYLQALHPEGRFEICRQCAWALMRMGQPLKAIPYWEQAMTHAMTNDHQIIVHTGLSRYYEGQLSDHQRVGRERALHHRDEALSRIDETTAPEVIKWTCQFSVFPVPSDAREELLRILASVRHRKVAEAEVWVLESLMRAHAADGDISASRQCYLQAVQLARRSKDKEIHIGVELSWADILKRQGQRPEALVHAQTAADLLEGSDSSTYVNVLFMLGILHYELGNWEPMIDTFEQLVEREGIANLRHMSTAAIAGLVVGYARRGNWENAYRYFWRMLERIRSRPFNTPMAPIEHAVASICHGDKANGRWMWEGIPETMVRAQTLIGQLDERGITLEEMQRFEIMHAILPPAYVQYGIEQSKDPVGMVHLLAREIFSLDEHVGYWEYLLERFGHEHLEALILSALEHAEEREKVVLEWLLATARDQVAPTGAGTHLARLGFIPEPCWMLTGPFEGERLSLTEEQQLLEATQHADIGAGTGLHVEGCRLNVQPATFQPIHPSTGQPTFDWRPADDFLDAYIDCRHIFQTAERVCAYAWTVIESDREQPVRFLIGYDDNVSVWLNGELRFETEGGSPCIIDDEPFVGVLRPGWNHLLLRIANLQPGWGFILRIRGRDAEG